MLLVLNLVKSDDVYLYFSHLFMYTRICISVYMRVNADENLATR